MRFNWINILLFVALENGFLANRIEGLVLHHKNTVENLGRLKQSLHGKPHITIYHV